MQTPAHPLRLAQPLDLLLQKLRPASLEWPSVVIRNAWRAQQGEVRLGFQVSQDALVAAQMRVPQHGSSRVEEAEVVHELAAVAMGKDVFGIVDKVDEGLHPGVTLRFGDELVESEEAVFHAACDVQGG